jgi:hypothetical protein
LGMSRPLHADREAVVAFRLLGGAPTGEPGEAIDALTRRFLRAYGPAEPSGFARWAEIDEVEAVRRWRRLEAPPAVRAAVVHEAHRLAPLRSARTASVKFSR